MIIGIGCDIVEHLTTDLLEWESNDNVLKRIFSVQELELYQSQRNKNFISGRFAAKEAVLKCLGTGMKDGIALPDIQILKTDAGKPTIQIEGEVKRIAEQIGIKSWHISISHTTHSSIAFVVAEGKTD
jgi:holo-[acyl-carrier protein] synthase